MTSPLELAALLALPAVTVCIAIATAVTAVLEKIKHDH